MKIIEEMFLGSWELKEWTAEQDDKGKVFPFGKDPIGRITYDSKGLMAVQIMKNNRVPFISEDPLQGQPHEMVTAYNGFIAYCGQYEVDTNSRKVVHRIQISSFPNWVGQDQIRNFEFEDNKMILSTDLIGSTRHMLVWSKFNSK